jgi:hypothetical protein
MALEPGQRIQFDDAGVEVIVLTPGSGTVTTELSSDGRGVLLGKRYAAHGDELVVIVTKPGPVKLLADGVPMTELPAKATASGD